MGASLAAQPEHVAGFGGWRQKIPAAENPRAEQALRDTEARPAGVREP